MDDLRIGRAFGININGRQIIWLLNTSASINRRSYRAAFPEVPLSLLLDLNTLARNIP